MKILVLLSEQPYPPFSGSKVRNQNLWPEVAKLAEVRIMGSSSRKQDFSFPFPTRFFPFHRSSFFPRLFQSFFLSYHQWPKSLELARAIQQEIEDWQPDIIHAEELRMWQYIPEHFLGKTSCTFHNVETDLLKLTGSSAFPFIRKISQWFHQKNLELFESKCVRSVGMIFAYSQVDQKILSEKYPEKKFELTSGGVELVPNAWQTQTKDASILFTGSLAYWPNIEALNWFFAEILPKVKGKIEIKVAGSNASPELKEVLRANDVTFYDSPKDLAPIYRGSSLSFVPLKSGSGTRGKILESIGQGRMVITTSKGVEGLDIENTQGIQIADDRDTFASSILELCENLEKRKAIAERGFQQIQQYSWDSVAKKLVMLWKM